MLQYAATTAAFHLGLHCFPKYLGLMVIKLFFHDKTELSMKFITLINVKMPTFVGILTFISMINITSDCFKVGKVFIFQHFSFYKQLKFHAQWS